MKSILDDLPIRIIDPKSYTSQELRKKCGFMSDSHMRKFCAEKVNQGEWERVWKRQGVRIVHAYRLKK